MNKFEQLGLNPSILKAVEDMGFTDPSEIQEKAIPVLLNEDTDMVALAQTGTGKTAAFGFPLIQKINVSKKHTQALILSPTRELCLQITNELKNYSKFEKGLNPVAIYGGASITDQARQIERGAQIIVATPGRMQDMINRNLVDISKIEYCVLDEADEMLNMGFFEDIKAILSHTPKEKHTWLFSATMPKEVATIAKKFMRTPIEITVGSKNQGTSNVSHEYYLINSRQRYEALKRLADANPDIFSVIFCRTKRDTQKVAEKLIEDGYSAAALHGDLSQNQRDLVMKSFRSKQIQMLVATDVAARGIDVDDITHVINYQLPDEIETYTHRSGRTGRAGKSGVSMVIVTKSEMRKIKSIERIIQQKFEQKDIPDGMEICRVQLFHLANDIKETKINHEIDAYLPSINEVLQDFTKEELIKKFFSVEFTRFFNYYKNSEGLSSPSAPADGGGSGDSTRYFINVGAKDDFDWMSLKDFLKATLDLGRDDVYKVDVKDSFSFFNTDTKNTETVLSTFKDFKHQGRFINVEETTDTGGRGKRGGGGGGGRKGGKFNKGGKKPDFKGGGRRRSDDFKDGSGKGKKSGNRSKNIESSIKRRRNKN
ncbi:DEAD/DEAH box helicase [Salegentibacter salarius]|uniref:RNA helicase n=1 Tax=Salegentibacter salarius TaxID=435906 RepID=A0A2N0U185_9FLAO|nr:DEAD/DEAH box helicase [Salegentibacter salarius]OEY73594.1 ATP-dependent RNA helicase [Salegentibacter salarius]PKD20764.1 DEAD/DEAH box helicase [Salegentibacter salarius]SLJ95389.1 ATP-dependent RNA helicase DeaD [Salegentibacter salarius]